VVWAVKVYSVKQESNSMVMIMFVLIYPKERDPDSRAIFKKNYYYAVSEMVMPETYWGVKRMMVLTSMHININKISDSNNCLLKVSVIDIAQNKAEILLNNENAIVKTLMNDYTTENISFIVNVVFPYSNSHFLHFNNSIQPNESLLFVVLVEIAKNLLGVSDLKFTETYDSGSKLKNNSKKTSMYFEEIDKISSDQESDGKNNNTEIVSNHDHGYSYSCDH
ncbi:27312_t:CDS:2, partial [Racocetra persica]